MHIIDLEHLELTTNIGTIGIKGSGAGAFVQGYAYAGPNVAAATVAAAAFGQQTYARTNTLTMTSLYSFYGTSSATASGYAQGISPGSYASVGFDASADSTSFNGNSFSMGSSMTYSTYRTW